jgi:hypothetical protein
METEHIDPDTGIETILIEPNPELLKKALDSNPRVHYIRTSKEIKEKHEKLLGNTTQQGVSLREREGLYWSIVDELAEELHNTLPKKSALYTYLRGTCASIGEPIVTTNKHRPYISSIDDVFRNGSELSFGPEGKPKNSRRRVNKGELSRKSEADVNKTINKSRTSQYVGQYAYAHTEHIRNIVPDEQKQLIHPIIIAYTFDCDTMKEGMDVYILDALRERSNQK